MFYACGQQVPFPQVLFRRCSFAGALFTGALFAGALPVAALPRRPPLTSSSRWVSLAAVSLPLRRPRPATNLIRQRSTPVWLAIWRIWTGFANSQLRCANFSALIYIYASIPIAATLESLLRQTQIFRPICTDCLRHLRISAG